MHSLALELGMTVGELKNRMSYGEFMNWVEYYRTQRTEKHKPTATPQELAALLGA